MRKSADLFSERRTTDTLQSVITRKRLSNQTMTVPVQHNFSKPKIIRMDQTDNRVSKRIPLYIEEPLRKQTALHNMGLRASFNRRNTECLMKEVKASKAKPSRSFMNAMTFEDFRSRTGDTVRSLKLFNLVGLDCNPSKSCKFSNVANSYFINNSWTLLKMKNKGSRLFG